MAEQPYPGDVPSSQPRGSQPPPLPYSPWPEHGSPQGGAYSATPTPQQWPAAPQQVGSPSYPGFGAPPLMYPGQSPYPADGWGAPPAPKKKRTGLIVSLSVVALAAVAGVAGYAVWLSESEATYEAAIVQLERAQDDVATANAAGTAVLEAAEAQQLAADTIAQTATTGLLDATFAQSLTDAVTALDDALLETPGQLLPPRAPAEMPATPWEREAAAEVIADRADDVSRDIAAYNSDLEALDTASGDVDLAAAEFFGSAASLSETILAANVSAQNEPKVSFQRAAANLVQFTTLDSSSAAAVGTYVDAATALAASQQAELDEKAGPLMTARLEVEQFARDLAPGLMIDFDWAPIVAGFGDGLSVGGTAHWWMDRGYATLTLSNSVAELWGSQYDSMVRALVAHEVGHALTLRCGDMYDTSTQESIEQWATAWAIVNGYTADGNGVSLYGQPPQSMLDAARGCS